jgi:CheY-like chemotaxis protein
MAGLLEHPLGLRSWPGRGSVFDLGVPLAQASVRMPVVPAATQPLPSGRALVLDNEPAALAALSTLLTGWGWQVHASRDADQALAAPWPADLHILDYHLDAGQTGWDVWRRLRERHPHVPTVMLTADRDGELRQRLLEAGIGVLYKPLKPLALRQLLQRVSAASVRA